MILRSFALNTLLFLFTVLAQQDEKEAHKCKAYALIHLGKYEAVLEMTSRLPKLANDFVFERAYSLYRLKKYNEALDVIRASGQSTPQLLHLQGQIVRLKLSSLVKKKKNDY